MYANTLVGSRQTPAMKVVTAAMLTGLPTLEREYDTQDSLHKQHLLKGWLHKILNNTVTVMLTMFVLSFKYASSQLLFLNPSVRIRVRKKYT
jgi:hypothetical protein